MKFLFLRPALVRTGSFLSASADRCRNPPFVRNLSFLAKEKAFEFSCLDLA